MELDPGVGDLCDNEKMQREENEHVFGKVSSPTLAWWQGSLAVQDCELILNSPGLEAPKPAAAAPPSPPPSSYLAADDHAAAVPVSARDNAAVAIVVKGLGANRRIAFEFLSSQAPQDDLL